MKKIFICLFFVFFSSVALSQTFGSKGILPAHIGSTVAVEPGQPVVFLPKEEQKESFIPVPANWKPEIGQVQINSFGGQVLQIPNITHIPSYFIYIHVLSDRSLVVTERISLVLDSQQMFPFFRIYPLTFSDNLGLEQRRHLKFLWAKYNGENIYPKIKESANILNLSFFDEESLFSGVHLFELSYQILDGIDIQGNIARLFLPLLGNDLPYLTENMQILVSYPENVHLAKANALFGKNNQNVENAYSVYADENGHLIYKVKGVLPSTADIRLEILSDAKGFNNLSVSEKIDSAFFNNNGVFFQFLSHLFYFYIFIFRL